VERELNFKQRLGFRGLFRGAIRSQGFSEYGNFRREGSALARSVKDKRKNSSPEERMGKEKNV